MTQPAEKESGPFLQAAFFCERLLQEADGVVSAIRIVDRISAQDVGPEVNIPAAPVPVNLTFFLSFKTGEARGSRELTVVMESPSPIRQSQRYRQTILFDGPEDRGDSIIMPIAMNADQEGVYWFSVYLDTRLMTRVPLRVELPRQTPGPDPH